MQVKKKGDAQGCLETLSCLRHLLYLPCQTPHQRREEKQMSTKRAEAEIFRRQHVVTKEYVDV